MVQHYKIDPNRIYVTGLSYGGNTITEYTGKIGTYTYPGTGGAPLTRPAAAVPLSI